MDTSNTTTVTEYRVAFERIGRNHSVPDLTAEARSLDELAERIYRHARQFLASRDVDVDVMSENEGQSGTVSIGWGRFGSGTFERVTA